MVKSRHLYILLIMLALCTQVNAESPAIVRRTLQAIYQRSDDALHRRDLRASFDCYDPSCTFIASDGSSLNVQDFYNNLNQYVSAATKCRSTSKILKCSVATVHSVQTATVISSGTMIIVYHDANGKLATIKFSGKSRHYWAKTQNGWKMLQAYTLDEQAWINGQPAPPDQVYG